MMNIAGIFFYILLMAVIVVFFWREAQAHKRSLNKIKLRVHVNGTRGKSSVTRLIAAGLRAGGYKAVAKTTGTQAKIILPDGSERPLVRHGPANIREIVRVITEAADLSADALVCECMAIKPDLQWFSEQRFLKSHIGVITNVRLDHEDVMGQGIESIAAALANTAPREGVLVTTAQAASLLEPWLAEGSRQEIIAVGTDAVSQEDLMGFPHEVIADNVAIALRVCRLAGVERGVALAGMYRALPDAGSLTIKETVIGGKRVKFINALAANDPESTLWLWQKYVPSGSGGQVMVLLNCRADRKYRTEQLCQALAAVCRGEYILAGDIALAHRKLVSHGINSENIHILPPEPGYEELVKIIKRAPAPELCIFAAGNVQGMDKIMMSPI